MASYRFTLGKGRKSLSDGGPDRIEILLHDPEGLPDPTGDAKKAALMCYNILDQISKWSGSEPLLLTLGFWGTLEEIQ